jgi:MFS family permease
MLIIADFGRPDPDPKNGYTLEPQLLGLVSAAYSLGAICGLPFIGVFNQHFGRRWSIMFGSWVMVAGALLQGFSINSESTGTEEIHCH